MRIITVIFAVAMFLILSFFGEYLVPILLDIDDLDPALRGNSGEVAAFMSRQPASLFFGRILVHAVSALVVGLILGFSIDRKWVVIATGVVVTLLGGAVAYLSTPGAPGWYIFIDLLIYVPATWLGFVWTKKSVERANRMHGASRKTAP